VSTAFIVLLPFAATGDSSFGGWRRLDRTVDLIPTRNHLDASQN